MLIFAAVIAAGWLTGAGSMLLYISTRNLARIWRAQAKIASRDNHRCNLD